MTSNIMISSYIAELGFNATTNVPNVKCAACVESAAGRRIDWTRDFALYHNFCAT